MEIYRRPEKSVELVDVTEQFLSGKGHFKTLSEGNELYLSPFQPSRCIEAICDLLYCMKCSKRLVNTEKD